MALLASNNQVPAWESEALDHLPVAVLVLDEDGSVAFANPSARSLLVDHPASPVATGELLGSCAATGAMLLPLAGRGTGEGRLLVASGRTLLWRSRRLPSGSVVVTLAPGDGSGHEVEQTCVDPLTGLGNRLGLHTALTQLLAQRTPLTVFMVALHRFKLINDTLGPQVGDSLLAKAGERLSGLAGDGDMVARVGDDDFVVVKAGMAERADAEALATRILDLVARSYALEGQMVNIGASVGIARSPTDASDCEGLLRKANLALHTVNEAGQGKHAFFAAAMDLRLQERRTLELDLRRALALKEFHLVYQPQIDLVTQEVVGFEALLRWQSATRGSVSPAAFIPLAEEIGLIVPLGEWVLRTATRQAAAWPRPVSIAVNLSPLQFRNPMLIQTVISALASSGLDPRRLELEITEGALMEDTDTVVATLHKLRGLGVRVSMDDFGTGYSSLSYLQKFPFDKIKIDQSFVRDMDRSEEASAIVRAVARLGASLGMATTAEGVETEEQLTAIRAEGCTQVQGYLTGKPMAGEAAALLLAEPGCTDAPRQGTAA